MRPVHGIVEAMREPLNTKARAAGCFLALLGVAVAWVVLTSPIWLPAVGL